MNLTCIDCKFLMNDDKNNRVCASHDSLLSYGTIIDDFKDQPCFVESFGHFCKRKDSLKTGRLVGSAYFG